MKKYWVFLFSTELPYSWGTLHLQILKTYLHACLRQLL